MQKSKILQEALTLFNTYGIKRIRMDDIARQLGMSKKTIYQYVRNKHTLVEQAMLLQLEDKSRSFEEIAGGRENAIEKMIRSSRMIVQMLIQINPDMEYDLKKFHPSVFRKVSRKRRQKIYDAIRSVLRQGKEEGLCRNEMDEDVVARMQLVRIEHLFHTDIFSPDELRSSTLHKEMFIYHMYGIMNNRGRKIFEKQYKPLNG